MVVGSEVNAVAGEGRGSGKLTSNIRTTCGNDDDERQQSLFQLAIPNENKKQGATNEKETPNNENGNVAFFGDGRTETGVGSHPNAIRPSVRRVHPPVRLSSDFFECVWCRSPLVRSFEASTEAKAAAAAAATVSVAATTTRPHICCSWQL